MNEKSLAGIVTVKRFATVKRLHALTRCLLSPVSHNAEGKGWQRELLFAHAVVEWRAFAYPASQGLKQGRSPCQTLALIFREAYGDGRW